ncbi:hypothetical protein F5Y19DRAFT_468782 [Xylariaceae sp. FL1651]|nr:hypothetical protein F5Y19DRAFT_468782 [Xylariaceae sp. FL1651]
MEEFAHLSREQFQNEQNFQYLDGKQYQTISIDATAEVTSSYRTERRQPNELANFFNPQQSNLQHGDGALASLRLVVINHPIHDGGGPAAPILISKETFLQLIDLVEIDPTALWLLLNQYDGLHHLSSATTKTYYLGVSEIVLIWSFKASSLRTSAFAIPRRSAETVQWIWFSRLLEQHQKYIHTPMLLPYVLGLSLCCAYDQQVVWRQARDLQAIEKTVGYGKDSHTLQRRNDVTTLAVAIQNVGGILTHTANKERHFVMIENILKAIESYVVDQNGSIIRFREKIEGSNKKLVAIFPSLRARIQSSRAYLAYLKERADRISTVVTIRPDDARRCFSEHGARGVEPADCRGIEA